MERCLKSQAKELMELPLETIVFVSKARVGLWLWGKDGRGLDNFSFDDLMYVPKPNVIR